MIHVTRGHQRFFVYLLSTPAIHVYDTRYKRTSAVLCLFTLYSSNTCVWYTLQEDSSVSLFIYSLLQQYMCMTHVTRGHQRFFVYLLSTPAIHVYDTRYKRTAAVLCLFTLYSSNTCVWYTLQEDSSGSLFIYSLLQQYMCMYVTRGHQRFFVYLLSTPAIHVYVRYKRTSVVLCLFTIYSSNTYVCTLQEDISGSLFIYSLPQQYMCMYVTRGHQWFFVYLLSTPAIHMYVRYKSRAVVLCLFTLYSSNTYVCTLQEDISGSLFIYSLPQQYMCMYVTRGHQWFFVYLLSTPAIHVYVRYKSRAVVLCLFTLYSSNTCVWYTLQEDISGSLFIYSLPQQYMCMYVTRGHQPHFVYLLSTQAIHVYDTRYKRTSAVLSLFTLYPSNTCVWYTLQEDISGSLFIYSLPQQYMCMYVTRGHQWFFVYLLSTPAIHVYDTLYKRTAVVLCLFTLYSSNTCVWYTLQEDISGSLFIYYLLQQYMCMIHVTRGHQPHFVYLLSTPAIHVYVRYKRTSAVLCFFTLFPSNTCVWYTLQEDINLTLFIYYLLQQYMCMIHVTRGHQPHFVYLLSTPAIHVYDTRYKRTLTSLCLFTIYSSNTCVCTLQEDISGSLFIYSLPQQYMCMIHVTRGQQRFFVYLLYTPAIHVYVRYKRTSAVLCLFILYPSNTCVWYTLQEEISGSLFIYSLPQQYMCMIHVTRGHQRFFVYLLSTPAIHVYDTRYKRTSTSLCLFTIYSSNTCVWYTLQEDINLTLFIYSVLKQYMCMIHVTRGHQPHFVYLLSTPAIHVYVRYKRTSAVLCLFTLYPSNTCVWYTLQEDSSGSLFIYYLLQQYMCMIHVTRGHQRFFVYLLSTLAIHVYDTRYKTTSAVLCLFTLYPSNTCVWYTLQEDTNLTLFIYYLLQQYMCMYVTRGQQWFFVYLLSTPTIHVYDTRYKRTSAILCLFTLYPSNTCVWYTLQEDINLTLFIYYLLQQYMCMIHVTRGHQPHFVYLLSTPAIHVYVRYKRTSAVLCLFTLYPSNTCVWYTLQEDINLTLFIHYLLQQYMCMIHVTRGHQRFFVYLLSTPAIHVYDTRYKRTSAVLCLFTIYSSNTCVWYTLQEDISGSLFIYSLPQQYMCMHVTRGHQPHFVYLLSTPAIHVYVRYKRTSTSLCLFTIYSSNTCVWYTLQEDISGSLFIYSLPQQYMCMIHVTRGHQPHFVYLLSTPAIHVYDTRYKRTPTSLCLFTIYSSNTCVWYTLQEDISGSLFIYSLLQQYMCMYVTRGHQWFFVYLLSTPAIHVYVRYKRTSVVLCLFTLYSSNTCVCTLQEDISGSLFIYYLLQQYICMIHVTRGHQRFFVYLLSTPAIHVYDTRYKRTSVVLCLFTLYSSNTCVWYTLQEDISGSLFIYYLLQQYMCMIHVTRGHQWFFVYLLSTPAIHVYDTRYKRTSVVLCLFTLYPSNTCVCTLQEDISGSLFIYSLPQQYMCMYVTRGHQWFFVYLLSTPAIHVYDTR